MEHTVEGIKESARELCRLGCGAVLVKGGHALIVVVGKM